MMMNAEKNTPPGKSHFLYGINGITGMLILGVVIPIAAIVLLHLLLPAWKLVHAPLHAFMESLGILAAFSLALLLLFIRKENRDLTPHVWIASGLLAMGILDSLHAAQTLGAPFVGLRSASNLFAGILFSLVWLPPRASRSRAADLLPFVTVGVVACFGLFVIASPGVLPEMIDGEGYTLAAKFINAAGGVFFLVAAARFVTRYRAGVGFDDFLFASLCLLFGMAGVLFPFSFT